MSDAETSLSLEECKTIFDLTRMWGFDKVRRIAKDRIRKHHWTIMPSADKITFAFEFELEDWYFDAYSEIVTRKESLDRKSTRLNSSHSGESRMPSSA